MKKQIINVAILLSLSPVIFANQETDTRVFLENDKIYYTGTLTPEGMSLFLRYITTQKLNQRHFQLPVMVEMSN